MAKTELKDLIHRASKPPNRPTHWKALPPQAASLKGLLHGLPQSHTFPCTCFSRTPVNLSGNKFYTVLLVCVCVSEKTKSEKSCLWLSQFNNSARSQTLGFSGLPDSTIDKTEQGHEKLQVTQDIQASVCFFVLTKSEKPA